MIAVSKGFLQSLENIISKISLFASVLFGIWIFLNREENFEAFCLNNEM